MVAPVRCATPATEVVCAMWPWASPRATIQSASTPPPSPPMARMAILIGWVSCSHQKAVAASRRSMRRCSAPMTHWRSRARSRSQASGLLITSAR